jgi:hypothetical protein
MATFWLLEKRRRSPLVTTIRAKVAGPHECVA